MTEPGGEPFKLNAPIGVPFESAEGTAVIVKKPSGYLYWFVLDPKKKKVRAVGIDHEDGRQGYDGLPAEQQDAEAEAKRILLGK
jgi:hypothetical protein